MLALVLLAAANLANLTLAQMVTRRSELALRAALGGGRGAAIRLQVAETLLLAAAGGVAGVVLGQWSLPALLALDPALARTFGDIDLDWRVQLATAALTLTRGPRGRGAAARCASCAATWPEASPTATGARPGRGATIARGRGWWAPSARWRWCCWRAGRCC